MIDRLLTIGAGGGRPGTKITPVGIVVHYVGNPGTSAEANRNYFESGGTGASSHYIVGLNGEVLRLIPEDEKSNSAGKAYAGFTAEQVRDNNIKYISIETCHPDATGKFSAVTYAALIMLIADICKRHGWGADKVVRHYDVCGKICPMYYVNNPSAWETLKEDVRKAIGVAAQTPATVSVAKTPIMGKSECTAEQLNAYAKNNNPNAPEYGAIFIEEGAVEGVRGDLAFCQSCLETGFFKFGGDVSASQNNFCGLGATGGGAKGAAFATAREGIRAQIQHLKAYASTEPLKQPCLDPRFGLVTRGVAPNWEDLNGRWAVPGNGYGENIVKMWSAAKAVVAPTVPAAPSTPPPAPTVPAAPVPNTYAPSDWAAESWNWAKANGLTDGTNPKGSATREQVACMMHRFSRLGK